MEYRNIPTLQNNGDLCNCPDDGCTKTGVQYANVSTQIDVAPRVRVGDVETECVGTPKACCTDDGCDKMNRIIITQKIRIKIPIEYNVVTRVGESSIDCCDKDTDCD